MTKPLPPQKAESRTITLAAIEAGEAGCATVAEVALVYGRTEAQSDTVTYRLDDKAAAKHSFAWPGPIREKDGQGNGNLQYIRADRIDNDKALLVRLKSNAEKFVRANLILRLEKTVNGKPDIVEFDPLISNGGGPRG